LIEFDLFQEIVGWITILEHCLKPHRLPFPTGMSDYVKNAAIDKT